MNKKKVLFIMHMPPPVHGASMVGKWIHDSEYINSRFECHYLNLSVASNIADIGKYSFAKTMGIIRLNLKAKRLIKEIKPDLVYITPNTSGMPFIKDSITVNMAKAMGVPVIAHFHNKGISQHHSPIFSWMYRALFKNLKVLLIVPSLYEDCKEFLRIKDLYFCPNGTPQTLTEELPAVRDNETPEILFFSNMIPSKGVLDILDALYLIRGAGHQFHCTMMGAETKEFTRDKIEKEVRSRHLKGYVDYVGPQYGEEKDKYLRNTDILAYPTYYPKECFPLVILEAMEYKIPIVATREAGIPYSVIDGKTGLLCETKNPIDLSEKIITLLENPQLRCKMGEEGYQLRKKKFTLETFEKKFCEVLEQVLADIKTDKEMEAY